MKTQILTQQFEVEDCWSSLYSKLATKFARRLRRKSTKIGEIGCGTGRLSIPLMKLLINSQFVLVDRFADTKTGSYSKSYGMLTANLRKAELTRRAHIVRSDYMKWIRAQNEGAYDGVISCEFLPEITMRSLSLFIHESHRVLKSEGTTVHCFWSPTPRNFRQRLAIIADSNPTWTRTPPLEWFSPKPITIIRELRKAGFTQISKIAIESHVVLRGEAARSELRRWEVKDSFYKRYKKSLDNSGLEFPDWIVISAKKTL